MNLLDWSSNNQLAVCLKGHVYLWNASTGNIQQLMEMESQEDYISSVSWVKEGNFLAIGTSTAQVQVLFKLIFLTLLQNKQMILTQQKY